jgi:phosphatidate phosphatase APP1
MITEFSELRSTTGVSSVSAFSGADRNETVVIYPTYGHLVDGGATWRIPITGVIYEPGVVNLRRRLMLRLLRRVMDVEPEAFQSPIFLERIGAFVAATERGREVSVRLGAATIRLQKRTKRNGHFAGTVRIPVRDAEPLQRNGWLDFEMEVPEWAEAKRSPEVGQGSAYLMPSRGVSVISDIDDTIKHSEVTSRRALLANTFLREFQSVSGMAKLYQAWSRQGASFHYVSSSPWQLFLPLAGLREAHGFPQGTFHLRSFRLRDHMLRRMLLIRRPGKAAVIRRLLTTFPERRFVLIGDSGERDPELYAAAARRFPEQVAGIYIREIPGRPLEGVRATKVFRRIPSDLWTTFHSAEEVPSNLYRIVAK